MSIIPIQDTKASLRMADAKISEGPGTTANVEKCRPTLCLKNDTDQACYNSDLHQLILIVFDRFFDRFSRFRVLPGSTEKNQMRRE